jgi:hypothetical protein
MRLRASQRGIWSATIAAALLAFGIGCERPLFVPDEPRTQFDSYDLIRNQYADEYVMDAYGRRKPNLRARLLPKQ